MATYDDTYSRLIGWLKFLLPLSALAILSTLFLFARTLDPERAIPYADVNVDQLIREQRISAPNFSGVTRDGSAISLAAGVVRPDPADPQRMTASEVTGRIDMPNGQSADIRAANGLIDATEDRAVLDGGVTLETTTGYRVETVGLSAALDETDIVSNGPVNAVGPAGTLKAGAMRLTQSDAGGYLLVFKDGVRLVYDPGQARE